ncbi:MAG: YueI family protein [Halanaerobiales bacterium]|nr:YueI family protein [Halanaerobiales bacterium]
MMNEKSKLEKRVETAAFGKPELRPEERARYLGEFRERVLIALTIDQVEEPGVYSEVLKVLCDSKANKLILLRDIDLERAKDYLKLAREKKIAFKRVDSPKLKGEIGLVVVSFRAVDKDEIFLPDRKEHLIKLGLSENLITAVDEKICKSCWNQLKKLCPDELVNYQMMSWTESFFGMKCKGCL